MKTILNSQQLQLTLENNLQAIRIGQMYPIQNFQK